MNLYQNLKHNQSGSAVTGFTFIFPLLISLTLIIVQFIFIAINYVSISIASENAIRLARMGYSDSQIIGQASIQLNNFSLISSKPTIEIQNTTLNNTNLKIIKIGTIYKIFALNTFNLTSKSYAF